MRQNLTDITVRQLPHPDSGDVKYWDAAVPGFGVRVTKAKKSWIVMRGNERRLTTFGAYPEISLARARSEAKRLLVQEPTKNVPTRLLAIVAAYQEDMEGRLRPSSVETYRQHLKAAPDIALKDLKKTSVPLNLPNAIKTWKVFANWCVRNELLDRNPFQHVPVKYGQRSRVLTDDEIRAIWQYDHPPYSDIIKLCLLTGQRVGEVTKFNDAWIKGDTITIPANVAKNGREHTIPFHLLTAQYLRRYSGQTFNGFSKAKARMDEKTGVNDYTVHDIRRTFATIHIQIGTSVPVVEATLNHISGSISGVAAIYIRHNFLAEMRKASLAYETHIAQLVGATCKSLE